MDKSKDKIESMFDEIAPFYDRLNHMFTLNADVRWRKEIVRYISEKKISTENILDLASGTGDLTIQLLNLNTKKIYSADISRRMLEMQKLKVSDSRIEFLQADASDLPLPDNYFDIVTIGFGVRNFEHPKRSMTEIKRVIKPGGKLIVLEMFKTNGLGIKLFNIYFGKIMPYLGNKISKSKNAYSYLFESVDSFYNVNDFIKLCEGVGFKLEYHKNNFMGIVNTVYFAKGK